MQTNERVEIVKLATGPQKPVSEYRRFAILVLGSFGCIVCSFSYAWNLIADTMQSRYHFSQRDMSTIVTVGLVVQYAVLPYAFLFDYLGPIPIMVLATIYFPLGTLLIALCFMGKIKGTVAVLSVFNALMSSGCTLFDLGCCITVLSYFPTNRGPVTALLKTYTGLGSALVACLYEGFFHRDPEKHYFFLFALSIVIGGLCIAFLRLPEYHMTQYELSHLKIEEQERRLATKAQYLRQEAPLVRFVIGFAVLIAFIIFLPTQSALASYLHLGNSAKLAFAIVATIMIFLYLIVAAPVPFLNTSYIAFFHPVHDKAPARGEEPYHDLSEPDSREEQLRSDMPDADISMMETRMKGFDSGAMADAELRVSESREGDNEKKKEQEEDGEMEIDYLAPAYQGSFFHNLKSLELWSLWWTMFTVVGTEFVIIYNATNILTALQSAPVDPSLSALLTVLNGVGSAVGRLLMSYFEVWTQKRKAEDRIPITVSLFLPTGSIILSVILFLVLPAKALPLPYVVAALGNGFLAGVTLLVSRTIFAKDPAKHYNFCFTATMLASLVFNRFLYGEYYTVQAEKQGRADLKCYGKKCVLMPLVVLMSLACTAFVTDVVLHLRYRSFCQRTLAERARLREEAREQREMEQSGNLSEDAINDGLGSEVEQREVEGKAAREKCVSVSSSSSPALAK